MHGPAYVINGGRELNGTVTISGAKNAAAAILPAALMVSGICRIENVTDISDNRKLLKILKRMGADVKCAGSFAYEIDASNVTSHTAVFDDMRRIRASYYLAGVLLGRFGRAEIAMPGGCNFGGPRPIDQHVKGFRAMGADVQIRNGVLYAVAPQGLHAASVVLDGVPSVGATINIMLAAVLTEGMTTIENAAREPHVLDTAQFLNLMGADIRGAGMETIRIRGKKSLRGGEHSIIPDQIEAGTYMAAVAAVGGKVELLNVIPRHLECISVKLREMGVVVDEYPTAGRLVVQHSGTLRSTDVKTMPYPGFPTDMQPQITAALCLADGTSRITEGIWEDRFRYLDELNKMGAHSWVTGASATVEGVASLSGAPLRATDLRAGAALIVASLAAKGTSTLEGIEYVERGYEDIVGKLCKLGADIHRVGSEDSAMRAAI